jgi:UrcA family protein
MYTAHSTAHKSGATWAVRASAAAAVAVLGLMAGGAASAAGVDAARGPGVIVRYGDLDLNSVSGAERLYSRLQQAALEFCPAVDPREVQRHRAWVQCQDAVVEQAVARINSPKLAGVYAARTRHDAHRPV